MASQGPKGDENNEKSIANRETEGQFVEKKQILKHPWQRGKRKAHHCNGSTKIIKASMLNR